MNGKRCEERDSNPHTLGHWILNPDGARRTVVNTRENVDPNVRNEPVETAGSVSNPPGSVSVGTRAALIATLYQHAAALVDAGDLVAAKVAHDAAGQLLAGLAPRERASVLELDSYRERR